jgi:hypothetical protein
MCDFNDYLNKLFTVQVKVGDKTMSTIKTGEYKVVGYLKLSNDHPPFMKNYFTFIANNSKKESTDFFLLELIDGYPCFKQDPVLISKEELDKYLD